MGKPREDLKVGDIFIDPDTHNVIVLIGSSDDHRYPWKIYDSSIEGYDYAMDDYFSMFVPASEIDEYFLKCL